MKKFFFVQVLLLLALAGSAQESSFRGSVLDERTGQPLIGATLFDTEAKVGTATNFDGEFLLTLPAGTYRFLVSFIGYERDTIEVQLTPGQEVTQTIRLKTDGIRIDQVVISASQFEKNIAEETVSVNVLDEQLLENSNVRDLGEGVAKTPGVQVIDEQISIRGGSSYSYGVGSRTAVLVDGNTLQTGAFQSADLKFAPLENVEQVEVIKGASSVVYGSSALNGVVNIRTAWPTDTVPETSVTTYYGIFTDPPNKNLIWWEGEQPNLSGMFINHKQKFGQNVSFVGGGHIDNINSYLESANESRVRANGKIRVRSSRVEGLVYGTGMNLMWESSDRFIISEGMGDNAWRSAFTSEDNYFRTAVSPFMTYNSPKGHRWNVQSQYFNKWRQGVGDDINTSENGFNLHPQHQYAWQGDRMVVRTTVGIPLEFTINQSNLFENDGWVGSISYAGYAQAEMKTDRLSLVGGMRYETVRQDGGINADFPVFRSGINYRSGKATYLRGSWGQGFRVPSIAETRVTGDLIDGVFIFPNRDLLTERSWNAEVGVKQGLRIGDWTGYADFAFFWQEFTENMIEYRLGVHSIIDPFTGEQYPGVEPIVEGLQDPLGTGLRPFNVEAARIAGYEVTLAGKGMIGEVEVRTLMGYTYNFPANLNSEENEEIVTEPEIQPGDPSNQNLGNFFDNFFTYMFRRVPDDQTNMLLQIRPRHLATGDIEFNYRKFSIGFTAQYVSFPERIPALYYIMFGVLEGSIDISQDLTLLTQPIDQSVENAQEAGVSLFDYVNEHQQGDLILGARVGYEASERFRYSLIVKNLTNHIYALRPAKFEAPLNLTFQMRYTF